MVKLGEGEKERGWDFRKVFSASPWAPEKQSWQFFSFNFQFISDSKHNCWWYQLTRRTWNFVASEGTNLCSYYYLFVRPSSLFFFSKYFPPFFLRSSFPPRSKYFPSPNNFPPFTLRSSFPQLAGFFLLQIFSSIEKHFETILPLGLDWENFGGILKEF